MYQWWAGFRSVQTAPVRAMCTWWCRYCRTIAAELLSRLALDAEHRQIIESAHAVKPLCDMLGMRAPQQVTPLLFFPTVYHAKAPLGSP